MRFVTKVFAICPHCEKYEFAVSHLSPDSQPGSWMCDECGYYSQVKVSGTKLKPKYSIALTGERGYPITVTLTTRTEPPVVFKVHAWKYGHSSKDSPEEFVEHQRYFYEEHTCPTNCLSSTEKLIFKGDDDPHGLFEMKSIEVGHVAIFQGQETKWSKEPRSKRHIFKDTTTACRLRMGGRSGARRARC